MSAASAGPGSLSQLADDLRARAFAAWRLADPQEKRQAVETIGEHLPAAQEAGLARVVGATGADARRPLAGATSQAPGRPERPALVDPRRVPQRTVGSRSGRAALLHAIAHIEFNAINLALDAAWRFPAMPGAFLVDWLSVALDEARHFRMVATALGGLGHAYGDFPAHDGLWQAAHGTRDDALARMALVPRVFEARGLDATPQIQARLRAAGDVPSAELLQVILDEEVRHVRIGDHWFRWLCERQGVEPAATFRQLVLRHRAPRPRGALNRSARLAAGFSADEIDWLQGSL